MAQSEKKYVVIDGNSIVNRAFYGIRLLSNAEGVYTNALLGFLNIYAKLMAEETPDGVCVCFDLKAPTFRHRAYEGYKATRHAMPEELAVQIPLLKQLLDAMQVCRLEIEGYEADDLLGTLSRRIADNGDLCTLVTGDRDSLQLVRDGVTLRYVSTRMGRTETTLYDTLKIQLDYGIDPIQFIEVKSLMGDTSDNIPGVKGIGEKTAMDLIRRFETLDGVYAHLDDPVIRPAVRAKLEAGRESAELSRMLAEICCDAPVDVPAENLACKPYDNDALYGLLEKLELNSLIAKLHVQPPKYAASSEGTASVHLREQQRVSDPAALCKTLANGRAAAAFDASFENASFSGENGVFLLSLADQTEEQRHAALRALFTGLPPIICHDSKRIYRFCLDNHLPAPSFSMDTRLAAYLLNQPLDFETLARRFLSVNAEQPVDQPMAPAGDNQPEEQPEEQMDLFSALENQTENQIPLDEALRMQSEQLLALEPLLRAKIAENQQDFLLYEVEMPLSEVLANMEYDGFRIDTKAMAAFGECLDQQIAEAEAEIYQLAGEPFNINSPRQLGVILFEKLGLPSRKKTKTGYSTNIDVLRPLIPYHPIIGRILAYRALTKLKSTYVEGLLKQVQPDGRIHSTFDQTGTATGRLSSSEPNLQNIPVRQEPGSQMRQMFIAKDGALLADADYSQIELRILAHIADDQTMLHAFANGEDIHTITAARVFDIPPETVTAKQRTRAKAVNFGIVYGISDFALAEDIGTTRSEAHELIEKYLTEYAGIRQYMERVVQTARETGYVETLDHRRRYLPDLRASKFNTRAAAERIALNTPILGTAADIIKRAMVLVFRRLRREQMASRLILQVHDELIVEAPAEEAARAAHLLSEEMEHAAQLHVRLAADSAVGFSWADTKQ